LPASALHHQWATEQNTFSSCLKNNSFCITCCKRLHSA
jgi:hypothetical protein